MDRRLFQEMAQALRGGAGAARVWFDSLHLSGTCSVAGAATVAGLLPEDRFDEQPLFAEDSSGMFVCQCRLDDREELLEKLRLRDGGNVMADSAIVHAAYQRWGRACVAHIYGDFAFAACSLRDGSVVAAVDPLGHSRLFYAAEAGRIAMSTQMAAMRAYLRQSLAANETALGLLGAACLRSGETGFAGVRYLPGGHMLEWSGGVARVERWWKPTTEPSIQFRDSSACVEIAEDLLRKAVRSCLRSTTPVTSLLSGGLDSGLITAMAAEELHKRGESMQAYTAAANPGNRALQRRAWDVDDAPLAEATAGMHPNLEHRILRTEERVALDLLPEIWKGSAIALRNGANHVWIDSIARRAREAGSRVLLAGAHGNHGISHNGAGAVVELLRRRQWGAALRVARELHTGGERSFLKSIGGAVMPQAAFDRVRERLFRRSVTERGERHFLSEAFQREYAGELLRRRSPERTRATFVRRATAPLQVWSADPLPQWDVEMRDPTGNRRLVEALLAMPLEAFVTGGRMRGLARQVGRGWLPELVRLRRTQGQQVPDYAAVMARQAGLYRAAVEQMAGSEACRRIFDLQAVRAGIDAVEAGSQALFHTSGIDRVVGAGLFLMEGGKF